MAETQETTSYTRTLRSSKSVLLETSLQSSGWSRRSRRRRHSSTKYSSDTQEPSPKRQSTGQGPVERPQKQHAGKEKAKRKGKEKPEPAKQEVCSEDSPEEAAELVNGSASNEEPAEKEIETEEPGKMENGTEECVTAETTGRGTDIPQGETEDPGKIENGMQESSQAETTVEGTNTPKLTDKGSDTFKGDEQAEEAVIDELHVTEADTQESETCLDHKETSMVEKPSQNTCPDQSEEASCKVSVQEIDSEMTCSQEKAILNVEGIHDKDSADAEDKHENVDSGHSGVPQITVTHIAQQIPDQVDMAINCDEKVKPGGSECSGNEEKSEVNLAEAGVSSARQGTDRQKSKRRSSFVRGRISTARVTHAELFEDISEDLPAAERLHQLMEKAAQYTVLKLEPEFTHLDGWQEFTVRAQDTVNTVIAHLKAEGVWEKATSRKSCKLNPYNQQLDRSLQEWQNYRDRLEKESKEWEEILQVRQQLADQAEKAASQGALEPITNRPKGLSKEQQALLDSMPDLNQMLADLSNLRNKTILQIDHLHTGVKVMRSYTQAVADHLNTQCQRLGSKSFEGIDSFEDPRKLIQDVLSASSESTPRSPLKSINV